MAHRNTQALLRDPVAGMQVDTSIQPPVAAGQLGPTGLDEEKLKGILESMSPEEQETFLSSLHKNYATERGLLDEQMSQAGALRDQAGPQGRYTGRVYTAANPMEHIASTFGNIQGQKQSRSIQDQLRTLGQEERQPYRAVSEYLGRGGHGRPGTPGIMQER